MAEPIGGSATAPTVIVPAQYEDPITKALYVHEDLKRVREDWDVEEHISPVNVTEKFGDVESWVAYVKRFGLAPDHPPLLTWNGGGLRAVLDYHDPEGPGRCAWVALLEFKPSPEWTAWMGFGGGTQKVVIEFLEDHTDDILDPPSVDLMALLRGLRTTVASSASTDLRPDGTTSVSFQQDKTLKGAAGQVELPPYLQIAIPVLRGHVDAEGRPVRYSTSVRLRASVSDDAKLALRFSIPNVERVLETVLTERVALAKEMLGDEYTLLRAAG